MLIFSLEDLRTTQKTIPDLDDKDAEFLSFMAGIAAAVHGIQGFRELLLVLK